MAARKAFPRDIDLFSDDKRIAYYEDDEKYILEDEDGAEWEFLTESSRWVPTLDEDAIRQQQAAYKVDGVDDTEEVLPSHKRKHGDGDEQGIETKKARKPKKQPPPEKANSAVYITSLPLDVTKEEVERTFSRCGLIAVSSDTGEPRVKLYTGEDGNFKGDALVVYYRPESVQLAIQQYDDSDFRYGEPGPAGPMRVKLADMSYKKQKDATTKTGKEKKKIVKNLQKLDSKLADWDDDEPATAPAAASRSDKVVVLKYMFTLEELAEDPAALQEIKEDIQDECADKFQTLGTVANVTVFDLEPDGIATVRFSTIEAANACVELMNGRHFASRTVHAYISDGDEKFKKTRQKAKGMFDAEADAVEEKRLNEFGDWIEESAK